MAAAVGSLVGSTLAVFLLCALIERLLFKSMEPAQRAAATTLTAVGISWGLYYLITGTIRLWPFYAAGGVLAAFYFHNRYKKAWSPD